MQQHIVICSGGHLGAWALPYIQQADYLIGADRGAYFLIENGFTPDISIGDFDSVSHVQLEDIKKKSTELLSFDAIDKDYSDTELSFLHALNQPCTEITLIGAVGTRLDHSISNIQLLSHALRKGVPTKLVDEHNIMQLIQSPTVITNKGFPYISLLPYTEQVTGITLEHFKYPLLDATITKGQSIGVSNELLGEYGHITIKDGQLLVIQARD